MSQQWRKVSALVAVLGLLAGCGGSTPPLTPTPTPTLVSIDAPTVTPAPKIETVETPATAWRQVVETFQEAIDLVVHGQTPEAQRPLLEVKRLYVQHFQEIAFTSAPDIHWDVIATFRDAEGAAQERDIAALQRAKSELDAQLTGIAFNVLQEALVQSDPRSLALWFTLLTWKFALDQEPSTLVVLVREARRQPELLEGLGDRIRSGLLLLLVQQVQDRLDEGVGGLEPGQAASLGSAVEATLLYQVAQPWVRQELGALEEEQLAELLRQGAEAVEAREMSKAREAAGLLRATLAPLLEQLRQGMQLVAR